jgi:hypothetical protein
MSCSEWATLAGMFAGTATVCLSTHEWDEAAMTELVAEFDRLVSLVMPTNVAAQPPHRAS